MRRCGRIGCSEPARATALLRYDLRTVEIVDLVIGSESQLVELCADHLARLTPPLGWTVSDRRPSPISA